MHLLVLQLEQPIERNANYNLENIITHLLKSLDKIAQSLYLRIGLQFQDQKSPLLILLTHQQHSMLHPDLMLKCNDSHNQP